MSVYIDKVKENKGAKKVGAEAREVSDGPKERDKKSRKAKKR